MSSARRNLPVIDVSALASSRHVRDAMHAAARDHGFFYIENYGISEAAEQRLVALARQFFARPLDEKLAIENVHSAQFRGYTRVGQERTGLAVSLGQPEDVFDDAFLPESDTFAK